MAVGCENKWSSIILLPDGAVRLCALCRLRLRAGEELTKRRVREPRADRRDV